MGLYSLYKYFFSSLFNIFPHCFINCFLKHFCFFLNYLNNCHHIEAFEEIKKSSMSSYINWKQKRLRSKLFSLLSSCSFLLYVFFFSSTHIQNVRGEIELLKKNQKKQLTHKKIFNQKNLEQVSNICNRMYHQFCIVPTALPLLDGTALFPIA
ncbi:hypothetical protein RFI_38379 [Reticulomyxa filosa]|uniref:Uncharacterized protein n=1 Tax=Reticulomyxa filosa TaxID=46433 RepID=X6LC35_RETFI|nr:hypothetical protein RFI_38379 [Reticulomyxa filosa]|eukprot:ETN99108.1 hypothetical protein RFI_38379 [Reticulomyxa filosa]